MSALAELTLALAELLEAEGRALERGVVRAAIAVGVVTAAVVLGFAGLGLCLWSVYLYLATMLAQPLAALATGALTLIVSGGLLWTALRVGR